MLETSLVSFSRSYLSFSSREGAALADGAAPPLLRWDAACAGWWAGAVPFDWKLGLKSSAGWKGRPFSCSSDSR